MIVPTEEFAKITLAKGTGLKHVYNRNQNGVEEQIMQLSHGYGTDAIIITAGTSSLDPIEFAGVIARKKARVIIVGAVPTGFSRKNYYEKELELRMSTSYGPGRYDSLYEEKGQDYPVGFVRWTEQRNFEAVLDMMASGTLDVKPLITHRFKIEEAAKAYELLNDVSASDFAILNACSRFSSFSTITSSSSISSLISTFSGFLVLYLSIAL